MRRRVTPEMAEAGAAVIDDAALDGEYGRGSSATAGAVYTAMDERRTAMERDRTDDGREGGSRMQVRRRTIERLRAEIGDGDGRDLVEALALSWGVETDMTGERYREVLARARSEVES